MLDLIDSAGYDGIVVSEARVSFQRLEDFKKLRNFVDKWLSKRHPIKTRMS